jgi:hypothetical protein
MALLNVLAVVAGLLGASWILISALRTVVIPRPEHVWITTTAFDLARRLARALASRFKSADTRHRILGTFAPTVLVSLPLIWSLGLVFSFASIYWGLDVGSLSEAFDLSGSSLTTLGFVTAPTFTTRVLAIIEALMGLAIVALMISFLPTIYGTFSRREIAVRRLTTRAGDPPNPIEFLSRLQTIGRLEHIGERWEEWEDWFVELGETHTTFPALIYFRSARPGRSWVSAAETALDTAAVVMATELSPKTGQADVMIRSGYLALRSIADFYRIGPELGPESVGKLSISRADFDAMLNELSRGGVETATDHDDAWRAFAGWRINYDQAIAGLSELVHDVPSHWDSYR